MTPHQFGTFIENTDFSCGCWLWLGYRDPGGYGTMRGMSRNTGKAMPERMHRLSYEHFIGEIPKGLDIDHLCGNRNCLQPAHLDAVTRKENLERGKGHERNLILARLTLRSKPSPLLGTKWTEKAKAGRRAYLLARKQKAAQG